MRPRPSKRSVGNPIPRGTRELLAVRDGSACLRCGLAGTEVHHRRSRRVRDAHVHCACNCVTLCSPCHRAVHQAPYSARGDGWIVSMHDPEPGELPLRGYGGWVRLTCLGTVTHLPAGQM